MTNAKLKVRIAGYWGVESGNKERFIDKKVCRNMLTPFTCPKMPLVIWITSVHKQHEMLSNTKKTSMG